jgi:sulfur carrier protein
VDNRITVNYQGRTYKFEGSIKVIDILKKLGLNSEEHVVLVNGEIYTEDRMVKIDSNVEIHRVTSAG